MIWIITSPEQLQEEERIIAALLSAGASRVLLRKPDWTTEQYTALLDKINPDYYDRIIIRDQPELATGYGLAGIHWSSAARALHEAQACSRINADDRKINITPDAENAGQKARSEILFASGEHNSTTPDAENARKPVNSETLFAKGEGVDNNAGKETIHMLTHVEENTSAMAIMSLPEKTNNDTDRTSSPPEKLPTHSTGIHAASAITHTPTRYTTLLLSPVFDSISKPGYHGRAGGMLLNKDNRPVLALGGVDHTNIIFLKQWQFDGAALLGAIWKTPAKAVDNYYRIQQLWNKSDLT